MELKKGMWVITNDRMELGQIKDFCTCEMCEKRGFYEPIITNQIYITDYDKSRGFHGYKFYENLIDLIKPGDIVNGHIVLQKFRKNTLNLSCFKKYLKCMSYKTGCPFILYEKDIKNIVTKEQFESRKYVVERDTNE